MEKKIVRRGSELLEAEVDGELVALNVASGTCYGFNATATRIWVMLDQPKNTVELRDALMREFEVDQDTCEQQLANLLEELQKDGLIEVSAETAGA